MLVQSNMMPLATKAPDFCLPNFSLGPSLLHRDTLLGAKGLGIFFWCNHCPYVQRIESYVIELVKHYSQYGIGFAFICSNDITQYPEDAPDQMAKRAEEHLYPCPYLFDATQEVARAYQAACTPDAYLFDEALKCVYRGCITSGNDEGPFKEACDALVHDRAIDQMQRPSQGCHIKWCD